MAGMAKRECESLIVELGERRYPIVIGGAGCAGLAEALGAHAGGGAGRVVVAGDAHVLEAHGAMLDEAGLKGLAQLSFAGGESSKCFGELERLCAFMAAQPVGRDGALVAVGGGVVGDLAGFAAASYLRGIDFYQVPTTLLAMVDSSVGGKTGINIAAGKNLVGAFWQPKAVFISMDFLRTLPPWEFAAGMAEVIKYGMLYDRGLFERMEKLPEPLRWDHPELPLVIRRCCEIKAAIVRDDEKETASGGGRALLNLGHTFAHAIEKVAGYGTYLHGEAVAVGLALAARLSARLSAGGRPDYAFERKDVARVEKLLACYGLPTTLHDSLRRESGEVKPPVLAVDALMDAMRRDKKVRGGKLRFVTMETLGEAITEDAVDEALVRELWLNG